jgi:hypothetical protein
MPTLPRRLLWPEAHRYPPLQLQRLRVVRANVLRTVEAHLSKHDRVRPGRRPDAVLQFSERPRIFAGKPALLAPLALGLGQLTGHRSRGFVA